VILFVCPNDPMISPFTLGPLPHSRAFALEGPDVPIMMLSPNTTLANDSRLLLHWPMARQPGNGPPNKSLQGKPALILERDHFGGHRRDLRPVPRRRGHRDCGSLTDRVIRGADGGGITGPISPSGAVSRSTITGA
jgi:hypothetical protein